MQMDTMDLEGIKWAQRRIAELEAALKAIIDSCDEEYRPREETIIAAEKILEKTEN